MPKDTKKKSQGDEVTDSRFLKLHHDPRFLTPSTKHLKMKADSRFSKKELEKLNQSAKGTKIDRFGRKIEKKDVSKNLEKYLDLDEDNEDESSDDGEAIDDDEVEAELARLEKGPIATTKQPHQELESELSSDLESSSDDSDSELEAELDIEVEETKPEEGDPTKSFAVVNMDWDNLRAVDLFATFQSFVKPGQLLLVLIYPSEFGKEQMDKEDMEGPPKELFQSKKKKKVETDSDSDFSDDEINVNDPDQLARITRKLYEDQSEEAADYDSKALRRYQLQRLRYYYAIVRCDSVETAQKIYTNVDGTEYELTANMFDLRYVPDDMEFDDKPSDFCDHIPSTYKPHLEFVTDALQHSKVKLTWDETPRERLALAGRAFNQKEIEDMDLKAYLASDSSDDEDEQATNKNKYQNLLGGFKGKGSFDRKDESEDDVDMEITFNPGLDENKPVEPKAPEMESTIEAYKRKEKERRQKRMERKKEKNDEDAPENKELTKAELELLTMDDADNHFTMKDVLKSEKKKKRKHRDEPNAVVELFSADLDDDRFKEVFESHEYAIDPTNSEFKLTETMKKILSERSKRKKHRPDSKKQASRAKLAPSSDVLNIVLKLKRKHAKK